MTTQAQDRYLDFLVDQSSERLNRLLIFSFANENDQKSYKWYYLLTIEIKDHNVKIDGRNVFDQPVKNDLRIYKNIRKIATGQGDDYTTGCSLDYPYFEKYYKLIAIDLSKLSKQQKLDADPKAIQQIKFTGNLEEDNTTMFFIIAEAKETVLDFSEGTVKVFNFILT